MEDEFLNYFSDKEKGSMQRFSDFRTNLIKPLVPIFKRLHMTPDMISYCALSLLILVILIFETHPVFGGVLLLIYTLADGIDGSYARLTGTDSQGGALTDIFCDQIGLLVVMLCSIQYGLVQPTIGAFYITSYMVMIAFAIVQNAMQVPMQVIFRSKYYVYFLYFFWGVLGTSYMNYLVPVFMVFNAVTILQSFGRIKAHLNAVGGPMVISDTARSEGAPSQEVAPAKEEPQSMPQSTTRGYLVLLAVVIGVTAIGLGIRFNVVSFFKGQAPRMIGVATWEKVGGTPEAAKKYPPQGITTDGEFLYFSERWKDNKSRVYKIDPESMKILGTFDMPEEAVRTSGLAWDGQYLWGVDSISLRAYKMDVVKSFETGKAVVLASFHTNLRGAGANCFLTVNGEQLMGISDFRNSRKTIFVRVEKALIDGDTKDAVVFSYRNEGFSRGLAADDKYVYESEGKYKTDVINKYDLEILKSTGNSRKALVKQYPAPAAGVEDLVWLDGYLWTSDKTTFAFYKDKLQ